MDYTEVKEELGKATNQITMFDRMLESVEFENKRCGHKHTQIAYDGKRVVVSLEALREFLAEQSRQTRTLVTKLTEIDKTLTNMGRVLINGCK